MFEEERDKLQQLLIEAEEIISDFDQKAHREDTPQDKTRASLYDSIQPQDPSAFISQEEEFFHRDNIESFDVAHMEKSGFGIVL